MLGLALCSGDLFCFRRLFAMCRFFCWGKCTSAVLDCVLCVSAGGLAVTSFVELSQAFILNLLICFCFFDGHRGSVFDCLLSFPCY